ncbi:MAG: GNAT family N-acetyltransferase [Pseudomonadales bacterium]|nr:GNAT family N-acetyltransferase [Candidatus Woesebacteria bacterium]MCB9800673.1 GNAT family N-acetyltransferase [Pseudomonadales bacterium]
MNNHAQNISGFKQNITTQLFSDPCLIYSPWLQVDFKALDIESIMLSQITAGINYLHTVALKNQAKHISVAVPIEWDVLQQKLRLTGWKPALTRMIRVPHSAQTTHALSSEFLISVAKPTATEIMPLLLEQAAYHSQNYPNYYTPAKNLANQNYLKSVQADLDDSNSITVVIRRSGIPIAYLQAGKRNDNISIFEIIVSKKYRGMGIGSKILEFFLSEPKVALSQLQVESWHDQPALGLYTKMGFKIIAQEYYLIMNTKIST